MNDLGPLELLDNLVKSKFEDTISSILVKTNDSSFLSIWLKHPKSSNTPYTMKYLPLFYVIGSQDKDTKLSLKLTTFHGKVLEELNGFDNLLSDEDKIGFVGKLERMQLCQGITMPDNDLKLDASTFSAMYLVERLEENVIVRSHHCQYALYEDSVCKMCFSLNTAYNSTKMKYDPCDEDSFYYDGDDETLQNLYEDGMEESSTFLSSQNKPSEPVYQNSFNDDMDEGSATKSNIEKTRVKKLKQKVNKNEKAKKTSKSLKKESKTQIKCKHCSYETNDIKCLMTHNIQVHTPRFNGVFCDETGTFKCEECSFTTTIRKEYTSHISSHDSSAHQCQLCGKILGRKDSLKSHMNTVHKRPFRCPSCPYETAQESRLTRFL